MASVSRWWIKLVVVLGLVIPLTAEAKPRLLASIKPLALIAQEVAGDRAIVDTLLPISASPHDYPLKMSDHRRLRSADLVVWIGPELESFLSRPLSGLNKNRVLTTYELPDLYWPEQTEDIDGHHHTSHQHIGKDPHIWLDPRNAVVIALAIAAGLTALDPDGKQEYQLNSARFNASIQQMDQQIGLQLAAVKSTGFAVYHEGYSHFVSRYGLHQVGYVTYAPERRPGAKHLKELRDVLRKEGSCLFIEPYYQVASIESMAKSIGLKVGVLDPIGDQQVSSYQTLIEKLANSFSSCLADVTDR
ncbi:MAG TPA: zinc ABC transporter substrate-binding protein [Cellvibrio sp.]|nr:zinc ABC transporter substrate-binding protein [Cellvibrio sp.]